MIIYDLTKTLTSGMEVYPGDPEVDITPYMTIDKGCRVSRISMGTHSGTHVDAPAHFLADGATVDALPPERFMGTAVIVRDGVTVNVQQDDIALIVGTPEYELLARLAEIGVKAVGTELASIDTDGRAHTMLLGRGIVIYENLAGIEEISEERGYFIGLPLKISDGDGSPVRAVFVVD